MVFAIVRDMVLIKTIIVWQQRPRIEDMRWPAVIVCCDASIVAHFARKVRATNTYRTWLALWGITLLDF